MYEAHFLIFIDAGPCHPLSPTNRRIHNKHVIIYVSTFGADVPRSNSDSLVVP